MTNSKKLLEDLPWAQSPLLIKPMSGVAGSELAIAVTRAGGLGQIGFIDDPRVLEEELERYRLQLDSVKMEDILPIGIGIIVIGASLSSTLPLLAKYKPAVVIRGVSPVTKVWIQIGSVGAALQAAQACRPDALVLQGSDAGGQGHARGSSIITLVPEVDDTLHAHDIDNIPLVAAGGIMDGRAAAAAFMLGASGVVMGTRFLGADEVDLPLEYRREILQAADGGESTARSRVFDEMWGPSAWPEIYDGRCLRNSCYDDLQSGRSMDEIRSRVYQKLFQKGASGNLDVKDVSSMWAGTGVGMVRKTQRAEAIVEEVRVGARQRLQLA
ncbi:hypothetical protein N7492_000297 [Penicillium capsulatum]|uniref:Nitronate monooxygenase domain-containing protein n=1 Tax=Penicillium capsulatum TaxID=69766 RepID=A0A9W9LYE8_9EURO|nr:hypothetical protein N7492_000297 [Penicillium capsulatum]KAJ6130638.1 hypothetical protein N7512_003418 [Penicillium capsulatum]